MSPAATRPKLADVNWFTARLTPVMRCEPPEGQTCWLARGTNWYTPYDAKRHALDNPGHYVTREAVTRSTYHYEPDGAA